MARKIWYRVPCVDATGDRPTLGCREDASNADPKFTRNWVRREVLPLLEKRAPGVKERLAAIAAQVRAATGRA